MDSKSLNTPCLRRQGNDSFGDAAIDQYRAEGINTEFVRRVDNQATGTAAIVVDDRAENCIIVVQGENAELTCEDVKRAANAIATADAVAGQLETPSAATLEAFRIARAIGVCTVLTPAPAMELSAELLRLCDVCVPNRTEIEALVGRKANSLADAQSAAACLLERGVKAGALTMGSDGAILADSRETTHVPAFKVKAVDTTGAGDAFAAAEGVDHELLSRVVRHRTWNPPAREALPARPRLSTAPVAERYFGANRRMLSRAGRSTGLEKW